MMTKIKICGITQLQDAIDAINLGADAIGFIFYKKSKRYISPTKAKEIIVKLPPFVTTVGVFVNENILTVNKIIKQTTVNIAQLHGDESLSYCKKVDAKVVKSFRVEQNYDINKITPFKNCSAVLLDAYDANLQGGTGKTIDWNIAKKVSAKYRLILSGGLKLENIEQAIKTVKPYAVDINSGVEKAPGIKDYAKMKEIIELVKSL